MGWHNKHSPPPHTLPLISSAMQRLKSPFCGGQVGIGVGTTTGLRVGILVGLRDGSFVGSIVGTTDGSFVGNIVGTTDGSFVGNIVGASGAGVGMIDGTALGFEVGAIVPLHEPTTFQASLNQSDDKSPGASPKLPQTGNMHSYTIPSKDTIDPMSYEPKGSNAPVQPPMNIMGCCVGVIVIDGFSVGVMDGR